MKSRSGHSSAKKPLLFFFFFFFLPWCYGHSSGTTHRPCFPSRNIRKKAEIHPPPMCDVIIEQPLTSKIEYLVFMNLWNFSHCWCQKKLSIIRRFIICALKLSLICPKFSKITRVIYPQNCPDQTCDYWLITPTQQTFCIETNIF